MADLTIQWDAYLGRGEWQFSGGDLQTGNDLETAVLISLFTDKALSLDQTPPDGTNDRRGWWGNSYSNIEIGSLLWTLLGEKKTDDLAVLNKARDMCLDALSWMLQYGVASTVNVTTAWLNPETMGISVTITQPNNPNVFSNQYSWAWSSLSISPQSAFSLTPIAQQRPGNTQLISNLLGSFVMGTSKLGSQSTTAATLGSGFKLGQSALGSSH